MIDETYDDEYATCKATFATFRLYHPDLDAGAITAKLGVQPTRTQLRGVAPRDGGRVAVTGGWFLSSEESVSSRDVRRHLDWVLDQLTPVAHELAALQAAGYEADVSCYWLSASGHGGPGIRPSAAAKLVSLGLEVWFDVYFDSEM